MPDDIFRQSGDTTVIPNQQAVDAIPSEQSGTITSAVPVWRKYVANKEFAENNREAIAAENDAERQAQSQVRQAASDANRNRPIFKGANGKLIRKVGRQVDELDPEQFAEDPDAGAEARKSLWDREVKTAKRQAQDISFQLRDPAFHALELPKKDREDAEAALSVLEPDDPTRAEFQRKVDYDNAYQEQKRTLSQKSYDLEKSARDLESVDPDSWWQARKQPQPTEAEIRQQQVTGAQAGRQEADAMDAAAAQHEAQIREKLANGATADEMPILQGQLDEVMAGRQRIAQERQKSDGQIAAVQQDAQAKVEAAAAPEPEQKGVGDFLRGAQVSVRQIPQLAYGVAGLFGATAEKITGVGEGLKNWGFAGYKEAEEKAAPLQRENDDVTKAWHKAKTGDVGALVDWAQYGLGYALGQMGETLAVSFLGGVAGAAAGSETGPGAVITGAGGAVAAGVGKNAFKTIVKSMVEKAISKQAMKMAEKAAVKAGTEATAENVAKLAASASVRKAAAKSIGSNVAVMSNAFGMELGSIYPEAEKQAQKEGRQLSGTDLARVWGMGLAAGGLEGLTDKLGIDALTGKFSSVLPKGRIAAATIAGAAGIGVEGTTEFLQTGMERLGARQSLTDDEAKGDYINSAALGALGGGAIGAGGAVINHEGPKKTPEAPASPENTTPDVDTHLAALDPEAAPATAEEIAKASSTVGNHPADIADGVLIERELSDIEAEDSDALASAEQSLVDAQASGDKGAVTAAETMVEKTRAASGRADLARAVLKIGSGKQLDDLTASELTAVGYKEAGDSFKPMTTSEMEKAGVAGPMIRQGADESLILTDEALKKVGETSTRARARVAMTESEAIQKAKERKLSADASANGVQGDSATGSVIPNETSGASAEYDVPMANGATLRVTAASPAAALDEAAAQSPLNVRISGDPAVLVPKAAAPATTTGTAPKPAESTAPDASVPPAADSGTTGNAKATKGSKMASVPLATIAAHDKIKQAKKSPRLSAIITVSNDPAARAEATPDGRIILNPERIVSDAIASGMSEKEAVEYFGRVLDEEIRHAAQYAAAEILWKKSKSQTPLAEWRETYYSAIWSEEFSGDKGDTVRSLYTSNEDAKLAAWNAMSDGNKALEAIRMMSQDQVTEEAFSLWANIGEKLRLALRASLMALKQFATDASPALQKEITNLENALRALKSTEGNSKTAPPSLNTDSGNRGDAGTQQEEVVGSTPESSGNESGRGEKAVPSLAIGSRVSYERVGQRVTGEVALIKNGFARVRPDGNRSISHAVKIDGEILEVLSSPEDIGKKTSEKLPTPEWESFGPESLGIPRDKMPQIKAGDRSAMVQFLEARGIDYEKAVVKASTLKPTQAEFSPAKVAKANEFTGGNRSILVSENGYVVDGHHQWLAAKEKDGSIAVIRLLAPIREVLDALTYLPSVGVSEESKSTETVTKPAETVTNAENAPEVVTKAPSVAPSLSPAEQLLADAFSDMGENLEAATAPGAEFYSSKGIPREKRTVFMDVADKLYDEGVRTPEAIATALEKVGKGKLRAYSDAVWSVLRANYPTLPQAGDWSAIYGQIDNPTTPSDNSPNENDQSTVEGDGPAPSPEVESGTGEPLAPEPSSETDRPGTQEQLPDNGSVTGEGSDSGTVLGDAPRSGAGTETGEPGKRNDSKRGGKRSPKGTDPVESGDGSGVVGGGNVARAGYRLADPERIIGTGGPKARFNRNRAALETYDRVLSEERAPTQEEADTMAGYIGWGSFGQELFQGTWDRPNPQPAFEKESTWLREHLGKEGWESIRDSIINAHYTDPPHVQALWKIAEHLGFKGGRVLEPSMGIGSFFGLMPDVIRANSSLTGIELDRVVGGMAKMLYPDANIRVMGYEKSSTADGFYDLVIGNWPFAATGPSDPRYNAFGLTLHDYFFVKALDQTRPGGLVIGITSSGTMDKKGQTARRQMARRADLVAAFRFPTGAFQGYAGTKVVTDVLILKKHDGTAPSVDESGWMSTEQNGEGSRTFNANEYWRKHPDHVLGEMKYGNGTTQGRAGMIVDRPADYKERLASIQNMLPADIFQPRKVSEAPVFANRTDSADQNSVKWQEADNGTPAGFYIVRGEQLQPLEDLFTWRLTDKKATAKREDQLRQLLDIRSDVSDLLRSQREDDPQTESIRKRTKEKYDAFVKDHGPIGNAFMTKALVKAADPMALTLENLEKWDGNKFVPRDILLKDIMRRPVADARGSIEDAYAIQRNQSTELNVDRIAELAEKPVEEVISRLVELNQIYKTPTGEWEAGEEYLGGNVRRKLREAQDAKEQGIPDMDRNISALEKIQPKDAAYFEIEVQMGASWIPREDYLSYVSHLLGGNENEKTRDFSLVRSASGWNFKVLNGKLKSGTNATSTWGTPALSFSKIFQSAMNGQTVKVYNTDTKGVKTINTVETDLANKKIDDIREELPTWLWADPTRSATIANSYNEMMNSEVVPKRNGSHLRFEGLALSMGNNDFDFRQHQKDAVWRGIMDGRMVGAHEVGTGKAQPLDAKILTPTGWTEMGLLAVGDLVIGSEGKPTKVTGIFPQGLKDAFQVKFDDGSSTQCCDEHLWFTQSYQERLNDQRGYEFPGKVRTTKEIAETLHTRAGKIKNHAINMVKPIEFEPLPVKIDAYVLGVLLGDGCLRTRSTLFTSADPEIAWNVAARLPATLEVRKNASCDIAYSISRKVGNGKRNRLTDELRALGVHGKLSYEKFIPDAYKFNSLEVRLAMLQGLMDTDGTVDKRGAHASFNSTSKRLALDVQFLVQSMGGTAPIRDKISKQERARISYNVTVSLPAYICPFLLTRKASVLRPKTKYTPRRRFASIEPIGRVEMQCISVEATDHLYVTDECILTHNTFTMAGLAVEGRRLGKFRKSLVFAHNSNAASVFKDFQAAYPGGKFLFVNSLSPSDRENAMRQIANDEWDAVVVPHSLIDRFALREETLMSIAQDQINKLESEIADALEDLGVHIDDIDDDAAVSKALKFVKDSYTAKDLVKTRNKIIKRIKDKAAKAMNDKSVFFEDLGIDAIMVDEAHMFKKIDLATRKQVKGLNKTGNERSWMLSALSSTVKSKNDGKGVFLFTGTPLTNNLNEAFNMMNYVMEDAMSEAGINGFDDWFNSFAAAVSDVELTSGGYYEPVTRLLSFINVPELARLAGRYFDVVQAKNMPEFVPRESTEGKTPGGLGRPFKTMRPVTADMSEMQRKHKRSIQERYKWFQSLDGKGKRAAMLEGKDTPLVLETEGIEAALDMRLIDQSLPDFPGSKTNLMIRNAVSHYEEDPMSVQMIFMERGFNDYVDQTKTVKNPDGTTRTSDETGKKLTTKNRKKKFNLVRDMVEKLVAQGVRPEEIAVFSETALDTIAERPGDVMRKIQRVTGKTSKEDLAAMMRKGKIRFAFGSTQTMGTGVNAQDHMRAMHHLDAPWTPGEFEQRNGRGHRQGNEWNTVYEYRYFTEGSHDGRRWQILLNKVKFISRFTEMLLDAGGSTLRVLSGDGADVSEGDSNVSDFEQSFSTAAGDPRILVRAKLRTDVDKLEKRKDTHYRSITRAQQEIKNLERSKERDQARVKRIGEAVDFWKAAKGEEFKMTIEGEVFTDRAKAEEALEAMRSFTKKEDKKIVAQYNGATIRHLWRDWLGGTSAFEMEMPTGSDALHLSLNSFSLGSIEGTVRGQARVMANLQEYIEKIDPSIASLREMMSKPFTRQPELDAKQAALDQIEVELNRAPQPAPSWLRNGAPVGSLIYLEDGKAYDVAAHRWDANGWWVLYENDKGMQPIDYRKVLDESGNPVFEEITFFPPDGEGNVPTDDGPVRPEDPGGRAFKPSREPSEQYGPPATDNPGNAAMEGWLFKAEKYRKTDGRLTTLRRLDAKMAERIEAGLTVNETAQDNIRAEIAKIENGKLSDARRGISEPLRAADAPSDNAYLKAVKSGNLAMAQKMVDLAAKAAGYNSPKVHHGTNRLFDQFLIEEMGFPLDQAVFFSEDQKVADFFAKQKAGSESETEDDDARGRPGMPRIVSAYLKLSNPAKVGEIEDEVTIDQLWERIGLPLNTIPDSESHHQGDYEQPIWAYYSENEEILKAIRDAGFDGISGKEKGSAMFAVFNPSQIKSADPVTYDSNGEVIPLSERFKQSKDSILYAANAPSEGPVFKRRVKVDDPLVEEALRQRDAFGANVSSGRLANFGDAAGRGQQDAVDATYEFERAVKRNDDAMLVARERVQADPNRVARKLIDAATGGDVSLDAADEMAFRLLIDQRTREAGNDPSKLREVWAMRMGLRLERAELARRMQIGYDRQMTPDERAIASLTDAIYTPSKRVEKYAKKLHGEARKKFLDDAGRKRIEAVQKELAKAGMTIADITKKNSALHLENSELMKQVLKLKKAMDQDIIRMIQGGASIQDVKRRYGADAAAQAQAIVDNARQELFDRIKQLASSGMSRDEIRKQLQDGLRAAAAPGSAASAMSDEDIQNMITVDFRIPQAVPLTSLPKSRKAKSKIITNPFKADWSRPIFSDGMKSFEFDTKDRAGIMSRVETIKSLAGAVGKISELSGDKEARAKTALAEINEILGKYQTDASAIFTAGQSIETYGFDIKDVRQVAKLSRIISMMDADIVDKASEVIYANMLSGIQTMAVNALATIPAGWEMTIGRVFETALNLIVNDPMSAQLGEAKYVMKAIVPSLSRAMSNAIAGFDAQHPMFDQDVLGNQVDYEKILGGAGYRFGGSISGKKGDIIRLPMRILSATDDFNRTLMACCEVGAFAYRIAKKEGLKEGTPEFDRRMRLLVNKPGSEAYVLASLKASQAIFSNPLPGQKDPITGKVVETNDIGDMFGRSAKWLAELTNTEETDNLFIKTAMTAVRVCFFPFQRTPFNILRAGARYTLNPISLIDILGIGVIQNSMATNPDGTTQWKWNANGRNAELLARLSKQLQGGALMMLMFALGAGEGDDDDMKKQVVITGSSPFTPRGRAERDAKMRSGIGPYRISIRRKDGSERFGFNYGRIEPMATTLAATIDMMKSVKRANRSGKDNYQAAAEALGGLAAQAQDKSFLRGISDLVALLTNMVAEPDLQENRKFQQFLAGRVAMVIPNVIKQPIREADGLYRERSDSFMEEMLYQAFPYGQKDAKTDPWGKPATKVGTPAGRMFDPTDAGTDKVNPIDDLLIRFSDKHPDQKWFPQPIVNAEFKHKATGKDVAMNGEQLAEFREKAGLRTKAILKGMVVNYENPSILDVEKVKEAVSKGRKEMKAALAFKFSKPQPKP